MNCINCNEYIPDGRVNWVGEEAYCESCFEQSYTYCSNCDFPISRDEAVYDNDGNSFCNECYDEGNDEDAPDNPDVGEIDRKLIISLSRDWLLNRQNRRSIIKINQNDYLLARIKERVGLVDNPIYIFGLKDRDEYQISASNNLIGSVKEFIMLNGLSWLVTEGIGCNRLGISYSIRKDNLREVLKLIKNITRLRKTVPA